MKTLTLTLTVPNEIAAGLRDGSISLLVLPIYPLFAPGDIVTVREDKPMSQQGPGFQIRILSVEARRVMSITEGEAISAGVDNDCWINGQPTSDVWFNYVLNMWDGGLDGPIDSFKTMWHHLHPDLPFESAWFITGRLEK